MTDKAKSLVSLQKNSNLRYSQSSSNSNENSEFDYNLYCFSQGYLNHEKGYWRGVLRNKNIDFDLRLNKDWTRRIELEGDMLEKLDTHSQFLQKFDNEYIAFINDNEIGWDADRFQKFKKKQMETGGKKQKNKEWLLSNGVKRASAGLGLITQSFKQFEDNEKNKESKRSSLSDISKKIEEKYGVQIGKPQNYSDKNRTAEKLQKTLDTDYDTYKGYNNTYNTISSSVNTKEQKKGFEPGSINKRIDSSFTGEKPNSQYDNRNLGKDSNYGQYQGQKYDQNIHGSGKGQTQTNINLDKYKKGYGAQKNASNKKGVVYDTYSSNKSGKEFTYGQKGIYSDQKGYQMPGSNQIDRMGSYDQFGKPSTTQGQIKQKEAIQTDYTKSKLQQIPQKSGQMPYMKTFQQVQTQPVKQTTSYISSTQPYGQQSYGKGMPKIDYSKYNKTQSFTEKKPKVSGKVDDKYKKPTDLKPTKQLNYVGKGEQPIKKASTYNLGKKVTNISRLKIGYEEDKEKYMEKEDFDRGKGPDTYNLKTEYGQKKYPSNYKPTQYTKEIKDQQTPSRKPIETGYTFPACPASVKKNIGGKGQKYSTTTSHLQKEQRSTYQISKPYGSKNYQQYTYDSRTQKQPGYGQDTNISFGISQSQLNTAVTNKYGKPGRMNKSVDRSDNFLFKDKIPYGQTTTVASEQKRFSSGEPGQKAYSVPKKLVSDKRGQKPDKKPTDSVKIDLSKYLPKQTPNRAGKNQPEIYEYYPLTSQKDKVSQLSKGKAPGFGEGSKYQAKSAKQETKSPRVSDYDAYDYNKPGYGQKGNMGKYGQALNNGYNLHSPFSDENKKGQRSKSIQNVFAPASGGYKGGMAYFKLQFLTTKEVCEKFWKSIDNGELSASMFDDVRASGKAAKLSNYLSPSKNSYSNEVTDYSGKFSKNGGLTNKLGMKGSSGSSSQNYLRNYKPTYKVGYN